MSELNASVLLASTFTGMAQEVRWSEALTGKRFGVRVNHQAAIARMTITATIIQLRVVVDICV